MVTIAAAFAHAKQENRLALIGYLPAGYPDARTFIELAQHAFNAGLDILEIGLPSQDPRFDGDVIRAAVQQVVDHGIDAQTALDLGGQALAGTAGAGLAMFYPESLTEYATENFLTDCRHLGISGALPVGMEFRDWQSFARTASAKDVAPIGFITYSLDQPTVSQVIGLADGFLYLQSQNGPTGQQGDFGAEIRDRVAQVKVLAANRSLPLAIGFGVRQPADVERIRDLGADGVIVGTAFLEAAARGVSALEALVHGLAGATKFSSGK